MADMRQAARLPALPLLIILVAVSQVGATMYAPSIPAMVRAFGTDILTIQLTMTVFLAGFAVSQIFIGSLSDRYGRRPVMLCGVAVFTLASIAAALAPTIELLLAARLGQSLGASVGLVLGRAIVRDCFAPAERLKYMAYIGMAGGLTPTVAPLVGGMLQVWFGWYANFLAMAAIGVLAFALAATLLRETLPAEERGLSRIADLPAAYAALIRDPRFLAYASTTAFSTGGFFVFIAGGPLVLIGFEGITPDVYGLYALAMPSGFVMGNILSSRISTGLGIDRAIVIGNVFTTLFVAVMLAIMLTGHESGAAFFIPIHLMGWASGLIVPNGFAGSVAGDPRTAGAASGLLGFAQMGAAAIGTVLVGLIAPHSFIEFTALLAMFTAAGWAAFVLFLAAARRQARSPT